MGIDLDPLEDIFADEGVKNGKICLFLAFFIFGVSRCEYLQM